MNIDKELKAQKKRVEALIYLKKTGCTDIPQLLSRGKIIETEKLATKKDNTLELLIKSKANSSDKIIEGTFSLKS